MKIAIIVSDGREVLRRYGENFLSFGTAPDALFAGFGLLENVEVHVISCVRKAVYSPEKLNRNVWLHPVQIPEWGMGRSLYSGALWSVRRLLAELKPDIVHGQGTERNCAICAAFSGFPNVVTIHGNMLAVARFHHYHPRSFYWPTVILETIALRKTHGVFCNSAYTEELVSPRARKTWRVPNALRPEFFAPPLPAKKSPVTPILLNVGAIQPRKRQVELLSIGRNLHRRGLSFEFRFVGELDAHSEYGGMFARQIDEAKGQGWATYLKRMDVSDLIASMDESAALLHFPAEEAFGLVSAEGLARNLKFFGSGIGGSVDIATGVEGAELFPPHDWLALENGISAWIQAGCPQPKAGAETMRERYHPKTIALRHLEIYREVLTAKVEARGWLRWPEK